MKKTKKLKKTKKRYKIVGGGRGKVEKNKLRCSPKGNKFDANNFSCYANSTLQKLKNLWNSKSQQKIFSNDPKDIWSQIKKKFNGVCDKESCWAYKLAVGDLSKEIIDKSFSPLRPKSWDKNKEEWLSDHDIEQVLDQYEAAYKCFHFFKPSPIDFCAYDGSRKVSSEICDVKLKDLILKGKTKLGFVFNTDPHTKSGSHWVSLFVNIKKKWIFFFDSVGDTAPLNVKSLIENIKKQGLELGIDFKDDENHPHEVQFLNNECGMYSLYFILNMLMDKHNPEYFKTHKIPDKEMNNYRKIYFNSSL